MDSVVIIRHYPYKLFKKAKGGNQIMSSSFKELISSIVVDIFKRTSIIHEFFVHKNRLRACFGIKVKDLFSAIVSIKSKEKITIITFNLNGRKYRMYLATGRIMTAIKAAMMYIKGKITGNHKIMKELDAITIKKKEYKRMKLNKKKLLHAINNKVEDNEKKGKEPDDLSNGMLVINLGYVNDDDRFETAASF